MNEKIRCSGLIPDFANNKMNIRMSWQRVGRNTYTMGGKGKTLIQINQEYECMSGVLKTELGILYPFQWYGCLDLIDRIKKTNYYRQGVKLGLNGYLKEMATKRTMMLNPPMGSPKIFHVADFPKSVQMRFREDLTDEEYYDYWEGQGLVAHSKNKQLIDSLIWKFRKFYDKRGVKCAEVLSFLTAGETLIRMCVVQYHERLQSFRNMFGYNKEDAHRCFEMFDLSRAGHFWHTAVKPLCHNVENIVLEALEERNVVLGLQQLMEEMTLTKKVFDITRQNVVDNPEVFRTKKTWLEQIEEVDKMIADVDVVGNEFREKLKEGKPIKKIVEELSNG